MRNVCWTTKIEWDSPLGAIPADDDHTDGRGASHTPTRGHRHPLNACHPSRIKGAETRCSSPRPRPLSERNVLTTTPKGLAARAGHWSARHRKTAIFGWLAFVVIAFVLGGAIGTKTLADEDTGNGESRLADAAINHADFPDSDDEQVLVTARDKDLRVSDPGFKAGVKTVVARLNGTPHVTDIRSPF